MKSAKAVVRSYRALMVLTVCLFLASCSRIEQPLKVDAEYSIADPQFVRTMGSLLGPPLQDGNRIQPLVNGDEIFPAMLKAIQAAKQTITFETFIYWRGNIAREFAEALAERAKAGVKVHVLIDAVGGFKIEEDLVNLMKNAGVEVRFYHPLRFWNIGKWRHFNNRTHRKILVVDGRIGFTGGVGIGDEWSGNAEDPEHWRDNHFQIEGPAVAHLQAAFMDNWIETGGPVLNEREHFPPLESKGPMLAQVFMSSSDDASSSMELMYLLSMASARKSIKLATPYFIPDEVSSRELLEARERGVEIEVIVPGPIIDYEIVRRASRDKWGPLLKAGIKIYEYQPTFYHGKLMIVDGLWVSIGSTNFDNRSFRLNDEANVNVLDRKFAERMTAVFEEDKKHSIEFPYSKWRKQPVHMKILNNMASIFAPQL